MYNDPYATVYNTPWTSYRPWLRTAKSLARFVPKYIQWRYRPFHRRGGLSKAEQLGAAATAVTSHMIGRKRRRVSSGSRRVVKKSKTTSSSHGFAGHAGVSHVGGHKGSYINSYRKRSYNRNGIGKYGKKIAKFAARIAGMGPVQVCMDYNTGQLTSGTDACKFNNFQTSSPNYIDGLMNEYYQVGQTDALADREENLGLASFNGVSLHHLKTVVTYTFKNNSSFKAKMHFYWLRVRGRTSNSPSTDIAQGLDDLAGSDAGWETKVTVYPGHSAQFRKNWKVMKHQYVVLGPGEETTITVVVPYFKFSPDDYDNDGSVYQFNFKSTSLLIRQEGEVVHDQTNTDQVGIGETAIDWIAKRRTQFAFTKQNAIKRYILSETKDTITTATAFGNLEHKENTFAQ